MSQQGGQPVKIARRKEGEAGSGKAAGVQQGELHRPQRIGEDALLEAGRANEPPSTTAWTPGTADKLPTNFSTNGRLAVGTTEGIFTRTPDLFYEKTRGTTVKAASPKKINV